MTELRERVISAIANVLKLDAEEMTILRSDAGYKHLSKWTSARHAEIIVAVEDEFAIEIDERSIPKLNTVDKFVAYVASSGAH